METVLDFRTMSKKDLDSMSSEDYATHFSGPDGDAFRERVDYLAGDKPAVQTAVQPAAIEAPAPAQTVSDELKYYEYQPKDLKTGKPIGGVQRFRYTDDASLIAQLQKAHSNAVSHIFQLRRDKALDAIGELPDGPSKDVPLTVAQPRSLSAEEVVTIQRLEAEGQHTQAERIRMAAVLGIDPQELVSRINRTQEDALRTAITATIRDFKRATPSFFACESNNQALIVLIGKKGWSPTDPKSWAEAYRFLHEKGALIEKDSPEARAMKTIEPAPVEAAVPAVQPVAQPAAVSQPVAQPAVPIGTGLTRRRAAPDSPPVETRAVASGSFKSLTLQEINTMSSAQYGKLMKQHGPAFSAFVDELESKAAEQRRGAGRR